MFRMLNKIKILIIIAFSSVLPMLSLAPAHVSALDCSNPTTSTDQQQCGACAAAGISDTECEAKAKQSTGDLNSLIHKIINVISVFAGIIAVIMLIVGGFRYITGSGSDQAVAAAKKTILYAIIGLVIVAFAQVIARFALTQATKGANSGGSNSSNSSSGPTPPQSQPGHGGI